VDNLNLNKHISGQFNAELESIRTQVMTMGGMVEQQLSDAITAMHNQDSELAKRVIEGDKNVNMMEVAIDEACVRIIAKRQPTASDLRLVMAIIKTIAELERIGDVADKICRTALEKLATAPAAAGKSGVAGSSHRADAARRVGCVCAYGSRRSGTYLSRR
jgi:phosphate transport system protein